MNVLEIARIKGKHTCLDKAPLSWEDKMAYLGWAQSMAYEEMKKEAPVTHLFEEGIYIREIFVPRDRFFIGRPHKLGHEVQLVTGSAIHITEYDRKVVHAPYTFHTVPGYITCFVSATDILGRTVHPNPREIRDVSVLENQIFHSSTDMLRRGKELADRAEALGLTLETFLRYAA